MLATGKIKRLGSAAYLSFLWRYDHSKLTVPLKHTHPRAHRREFQDFYSSISWGYSLHVPVNVMK